MSSVRTCWVSESAAMLDVPGTTNIESQRRIWWLADHFRSHAGVSEVVPGMNNLTVELGHAARDPEHLLQALRAAWNRSEAVAFQSRHMEIPVRYGGADGPDLDEVARQSRLSREEVVRLHRGGEYTVYFLGFLPGFAYLGGMDRRLVTTRRSEPRLTVPAGSVAIGGEQTAIYPSASPGGWQLIGRTSVALFDAALDPPSLLLPGDSVRFVDIGGAP